MKIILLIFLFCFLISPAHAYKEDNRSGEAQLTAGEQNTNLHKLSSKGAIVIKKLKKASEYVERKKAAGKSVNATDFDDILLSDKAEEEKQILKNITANISQKAENPRNLTIVSDYAVYEILLNMQDRQFRDKQIVAALRQQLRSVKK